MNRTTPRIIIFIIATVIAAFLLTPLAADESQQSTTTDELAEWAKTIGSGTTTTLIYIDDDEGQRYEVRLEIVYNAVTIDEAKEIIAKAMREHASACKAEGSFKKAAGQGMAIGSAPVSTANVVVTDGTNCWNAGGDLVPCN